MSLIRNKMDLINILLDHPTYGDVRVGVEIRVVFPGRPPVTSGPPEHCHPEEPPDFDYGDICINDPDSPFDGQPVDWQLIDWDTVEEAALAKAQQI
jgi:hypothetical protein